MNDISPGKGPGGCRKTNDTLAEGAVFTENEVCILQPFTGAPAQEWPLPPSDSPSWCFLSQDAGLVRRGPPCPPWPLVMWAPLSLTSLWLRGLYHLPPSPIFWTTQTALGLPLQPILRAHAGHSSAPIPLLKTCSELLMSHFMPCSANE